MILNSIFNKNEAYDGGSIYNKCSHNGNSTIKNSTFTKNSVKRDGGAIYNEYGNNFTVISSIFHNNYAKGGGAIYNNHGAKFNINNSTFTKNSVKRDGGVIYNNYGHNFTINNSNFNNNNKAPKSGGILYNNYGNNLNIINSNFNNNRANYGGVIHNRGANFTIKNSIFNKNYASRHGGVIYNKGTDSIILNSNFTNNQAYEDGGAICNMGKNLNISGSLFIHNYASGAKAYYCEGGAIFSGYSMSCTNSYFNNNHAENGGAIAIIDKCTTLIEGCIFKDNTATAKTIRNGKGGAIFINKKASHISLIYNHFIDNYARFKGNNVYNWGDYDKIENNSFPNEKQNNFRKYGFLHDKYYKDKHPHYYNLTKNNNDYN